MEINKINHTLAYKDFIVDTSKFDLTLSDSKTICHSLRDSFFIAYLNEQDRVTIYTINELKGVLLVGTIIFRDVFVYYVRTSARPVDGVVKTICIFLRYNPFIDRFREVDGVFIESECERLHDRLDCSWEYYNKLLYLYSKNSFMDQVSFLMSKINFENEQLVTETELV